ncbi:amidophosphoribosyltransferase [Lentisphaerota bacterium ZTH]|nr:amidophosphoribosyltransferase [Lentisphaerota bacterium]WET06805.1 amidophosphoribosyltransferase [Lentisphaerota bacterium ZTH]
MGGFFGVVSKYDCVGDLYYGTDYHSHLGTKRGGLAVTNNSGRIIRRIHDISNAQFRSKFDADINNFEGNTGIGIISDYEDQPLIIASHLGTYAIATVGKINNLEALSKRAFRSGYSHFSEMSGGELNPTELVATLINRKESIVEGIHFAQKMIEGSCSILVMIDNTIFAARDFKGRTPVIIGEKNGSYAITIESSAFPNLEYTHKCDLGPGEIVQISSEMVIQKKAPQESMQICSFLWVYYGYPSSTYEGINTENVRYRNGELMAEMDREDTVLDSVCGIPDSGIGHAIGYSNASNVPYKRAFVKYTPTWPRSFMPQNQKMRDLVARMKLIPIQEIVKNQRLLFCDDSIVRGTQLRDTVDRLMERGAETVHMRSACPPLVFGCKFLNFSRSRSDLDLVARRAIDKIEGRRVTEPEVLKEYTKTGTEKYNRMLKEIRDELKLGTLKYQTLENLIKAIGLPKEKLCTYCWDGCED